MRSMVKRVAVAGALCFGVFGARASDIDAPLPGAPRPDLAQPRNAPVNVIFDTDMWSDIDDALALAMLHALQDRHEVRLLAVTVSTDERWCAPYVDLVDNFYGHPIPIGVVRHGLNADRFRAMFPQKIWPVTRYTEILATQRRPDGSLVYPHRLVDGRKAPEAVVLLRRTLAAQPDDSVVVIQVGYATNLARLLNSGADTLSALDGRELIRRKVRLLTVMGGNFGDSLIAGKPWPKGSQEFNLRADVHSAQTLFSGWPSPIVVSGFEVGMALLYPRVSIERDFSYVKHHPVAETYRTAAREMPEAYTQGHAAFDLTAVLYAVRPNRDYFSLSKPGRVTVLADGSSRFEESERGPHRYLILNAAQKDRTLEAMVMLVSQPPRAK